MTQPEIQQRLKGVFDKVFDDPPEELRPDLTADQVDGWDSLTHINLVVAVEKEFKIRFSTGEIRGLANLGDMMHLIQTKVS